jgi:hypothetical protein
MGGPSSDEGSGGSGNPTQGRAQTDGCEAGPAGNHAIADHELFRSAVEQLRFVTTMFWQQAGFFLLIQGWLITVVSQSVLKGEVKPLPLLGLSLLGLLLAAFWGLVARNRARIIEYWRGRVVCLDQRPDPYHLYEDFEEYLDKYRIRRPTSLTKSLPIALVVGWFLVLIASVIWLLISKQ